MDDTTDGQITANTRRRHNNEIGDVHRAEERRIILTPPPAPNPEAEGNRWRRCGLQSAGRRGGLVG